MSCECIQKIITINPKNTSRVVSGVFTNFNYNIDVPQETLSKFNYVELIECMLDIGSASPVPDLTLVRCSLVNNLNNNDLVTIFNEPPSTILKFSDQSSTSIVHKINKNVGQTINVNLSNASTSDGGALQNAVIYITLRLFV